MIEQALSWIEKHALADSNNAVGAAYPIDTPGFTAALVPTLLAAGRSEQARCLANRLLDLQNSDGSFGSDGTSVFETSLVIRAWLAVLTERPELESPLRKACDWLLLHADPERAGVNGLPGIEQGNSREEWSVATQLCALPPLEQAAERLGEDRYGRLARRARGLCRRQGSPFNLEAPRMPTRFLGHGLRALRELGCGTAVDRGLTVVTRYQQPTGAVPARSDVTWVCPASLALLARLWLECGEADRGNRALQFLSQLQNPTGGFFGAYGVGAPAAAGWEDPWAVKYFLDACLEARCIEPSASSNLPKNEHEEKDVLRSRSLLQSHERKDRVLLISYLEDANLGDAWISEVVRDRLARTGLKASHLEIDLGICGSRLVQRARQSGFVCFPGGGLLERGVPEIIARFAQLYPHLNVPYGVLGLSAGGFDYTHCHPSLKVFADNASFFYTRDTETVETFRRAGVTKLPAAGVDVVFLHEQVRANRRQGDAVGANFREVPYPDLTGDLDWTQWSRALRDIGASCLVPDCSAAQQQLGLKISDASPLKAIAACQYVVAMRFHVVLAAAAAGVIPIPITYCPKVARLAAQLGLQEYCLGLHDASRLPALFERIRAEAGSIRERMAERVQELSRRAEEIVSEAVGRIQTICYG